MAAERIALILFTNSVHLIVAQIFLRRFQILLPVDLAAWTLLLAVQFGLAFLLLLFLAKFAARILPACFIAPLIAVKSLALLAAAISSAASLGCAILYFAAASVETALLFRSAPGGAQAQNLARTNLYINLGAAVGLYLAEKLVFRLVPLPAILYALAGFQLVIWYLWRRTLAGVSTAPETGAARSGAQRRWAAWLESALAGFTLFAGLQLAHRVLRFYLMDTADIIAEINVFSLVAAAFVSHAFTRYTALLPCTYPLLRWLSALLFLAFLMKADRLLVLPREILLFIGLLPLVVVTTGSYLQALSARPNRDQLSGIVAANLLGSLAGAVGFGYLALPHWGLARSVLLFALAVQAWFIFLMPAVGKNPLRWRIAISALGAAVAALTLLVLNTPWLARQLAGVVDRVAPGEQIVASKETPQDIWLLSEKSVASRTVHHRLIRNSHSMSGSLYPSRRYMKLMAYLGALYALRLQSALNIGYGTGLTAQALTELPLARVDASDISAEITELASLLHEREARTDPIKDARVAYHLGGARYFLQQTGNRYDIITGEPPPPANSSIAYLYTREFYALVRDHLSEGGVFTYWLPTHSVADHSAGLIWQTFCSVFPHCDLYAGTESNLIMVGSLSQPRIRLAERFALLEKTRMARDTGIAQPGEIFSLLVASSAYRMPENPDKKLLSDDLAYIEEDFPSNKKRFWGLPGIPFTEQTAIFESLLRQRFVVDSGVAIRLRPVLIYSSDSVFDPFRALRTLEALQPGGISRELALWLLGVDPGIQAGENFSAEESEQAKIRLADLLAKNRVREAGALVAELLRKNPLDQFTFALSILIDRLRGEDQNRIRRRAADFRQRLPRTSAGFAQYAGL